MPTVTTVTTYTAEEKMNAAYCQFRRLQYNLERWKEEATEQGDFKRLATLNSNLDYSKSYTLSMYQLFSAEMLDEAIRDLTDPDKPGNDLDRIGKYVYMIKRFVRLLREDDTDVVRRLDKYIFRLPVSSNLEAG